VPIDTNPKTRDSRLFKSTGEHVVRSSAAILRAYMMYKPLTFFLSLASLFFVGGLVPFVRFLALVWFTSNNGGAGRHVQSLVLGLALLMAAVVTAALGIIADLIRINRILIEDSLEHAKRQRLAGHEVEVLELPGLHPVGGVSVPRRTGEMASGR
jgi:hypothetical protein